jgi:hypothetical protein
LHPLEDHKRFAKGALCSSPLPDNPFPRAFVVS